MALWHSRTNPKRPEHDARDQSFTRLVALEIDYVHRSLRRLGVPAADIEDLCQDVFCVVLRRMADLDPARSPRPFIFGISYRIALSHRRKVQREQATGDIEERAYAPSSDADGAARSLVLAALGEVPIERRAVVVLHELDGVDMKEIATELGIPLFTAYSRLRKGRQEFEKAARTLLQIHSPTRHSSPSGNL